MNAHAHAHNERNSNRCYVVKIDDLLFSSFSFGFVMFCMHRESYSDSSTPEPGRGNVKHRDTLCDQNMRKTHHTVGERECSVTTGATKSFVFLIFVMSTSL